MGQTGGRVRWLVETACAGLTHPTAMARQVHRTRCVQRTGVGALNKKTSAEAEVRERGIGTP
jgi:hypothetical protein